MLLLVPRVLLKFLGSAAIASCMALPAFAAEVSRDVLERIGFFGTWAIDCNAPSSLDNVTRTAVVRSTGDATFTENLGPDSEPNSYVILRTRQLGPSEVALRIKLNGEREQELIMRVDDGRIRTISNRDLKTGRYLVKNGSVRGTGTETPWLTRCGDAPPEGKS